MNKEETSLPEGDPGIFIFFNATSSLINDAITMEDIAGSSMRYEPLHNGSMKGVFCSSIVIRINTESSATH